MVSVLSCGGGVGDIGGKRRTPDVSCGAVADNVWAPLVKLLPTVAVHSPMAMAKTIFFFIIIKIP